MIICTRPWHSGLVDIRHHYFIHFTRECFSLKSPQRPALVYLNLEEKERNDWVVRGMLSLRFIATNRINNKLKPVANPV